MHIIQGLEDEKKTPRDSRKVLRSSVRHWNSIVTVRCKKQIVENTPSDRLSTLVAFCTILLDSMIRKLEINLQHVCGIASIIS